MWKWKHEPGSGLYEHPGGGRVVVVKTGQFSQRYEAWIGAEKVGSETTRGAAMKLVESELKIGGRPTRRLTPEELEPVIAEAVAKAASFLAMVYTRDRGWLKGEYPSLEAARVGGKALEEEAANGRTALLYAVAPQTSNVTLIPKTFRALNAQEQTR